VFIRLREAPNQEEVDAISADVSDDLVWEETAKLQQERSFDSDLCKVVDDCVCVEELCQSVHVLELSSDTTYLQSNRHLFRFYKLDMAAKASNCDV
jgi:hypothetical protein